MNCAECLRFGYPLTECCGKRRCPVCHASHRRAMHQEEETPPVPKTGSGIDKPGKTPNN